MLGIFGEVGRPNSMKPLPGPKFLMSKVFENKFFRSLLFLRPKFSRPIPRLFLRPKFSRPIPRPNKLRPGLFFWYKIFRNRYQTKSETNIYETNNETFFLRPNLPKSRQLKNDNYRDRDWDFQIYLTIFGEVENLILQLIPIFGNHFWVVFISWSHINKVSTTWLGIDR